MALSATIRDVRQSGGKFYIKWQDAAGHTHEKPFQNIQEVRDQIAPIFQNPELLITIFIALFLYKSNDASQVNLVKDKTITFDPDVTLAQLSSGLLRVT